MAKQKYYVVWTGKTPGLYTSWPEAERQVKGFPGARYKSFPTRAEAEAAYSKGASARPATRKAAAKKSGTAVAAGASAEVNIYCDGACDPNPGQAGTGIAIYRRGALAELWHGLYNPAGTNNTAELLGLHHALEFARAAIAEQLSVAIHCDSKYAIDCITSWAFGWKAKGWTRKGGEIKNLELIQQAHALYLEIASTVQVLHVRGHAGIEGNELADRMSMLAVERRETGLVRYTETLSTDELLAMRKG